MVQEEKSGVGGWTAGEIPAKVRMPKGPPEDYAFAGWTNGLFGLDFRVYDDDDGEPFVPGWSVTHIPTGYTVCAILAGLAEAKALTEELGAAADWNFTADADSKARAEAFHAFQHAHDGKVIRATATFAPTSLELRTPTSPTVSES